MTVQAIFTIVTIVAVWVGLGSAEGKPEAASTISKFMVLGAVASAITAVSQFIALLVYVTDE